MKQKVIIGSDHGGFELKQHIAEYLKKEGYEVIDMGCHSQEPVDYPDIAFLVAQGVANSKDTFGIMIDGVGVASAIVANKVMGIRAACCWDLFSANNAREHNNANVLTLGGRMIGKGLAEAIVKKFLETPFAGGRHERRVLKIMEIEARGMKAGK
ncbi:MAG: ribose 5-phosphate isomerase B [Thermoplasmata archaeon]